MRGKTKKLLVLVLTLSLVATFIAPLPVARGQEEPPDVVWVDDDWKEAGTGSTVPVIGGTATIGENATATIQDAINLVAATGTVYVNTGTYIENLTISKPINLIGVADENGEKPVITTATDSTNWTTIKLNSGASGTRIENLKLKVPEGLAPTNGKYYHNIDINEGVSDIQIMNCDFDANGFLVPTENNEKYKWGALAIYVPVTNPQAVITIDNCTFTNGYYVTIGGYAKELTVRNSSISDVKSGINFENGGKLSIIDTDIEVVPRIVYGDSYAVRFGVNAGTDQRNDMLDIEGGSFIVNNENNLSPDSQTDFAAIIISQNTEGTLRVANANIKGEVVNRSTSTLYASGNYWGTDEGPFSATLAGPIVIYDWYADEQMTDLVSLDSVATKVPAHGSTGVALNAEVKLVFNYPVEMVSEPSITIGSLSNVSASLADDKKTVVITHPPFAYGTSYTVNVPEGTFYAKIEKEEPVPLTALNAVAIDGPTVFNRAFSWSFTTAARPLPPPPPPPEEPTPPGAEEPLPDSAIEEAISEAEETGEVVLSAPEGEDTLALTLDQLAIIGETEKPVVVNIGEVQMELPAAVVSNLAELTGAQVEIKVAELSSTAAEELHGQATNADQYKLAGAIFEITMELVKSDGSREDITDLGGNVKVYVPVPSDKQELAAAGLLTVARFNENTEAWEEISSSFDQDTKCMVFETTHFSKYAVLEKVLDTAAPTVVNTDPVNNATNVPIDKVIKVTFNEDVVSATNFDKITLADAKGATVAVTTTLTASVLTITPSDPLAYSTEYTVTIPAGAVKDTADNPLPKDVSFSFTTMAEPDTTAPEVESTDPANGAVDVALDKVIKVTFNEDIVAGDAFADIVLKNAEGKEISTKVEISGSDLTIRPNARLEYSTKYTVTIPAGAVKDVAGNPLKEAYTFSFTTVGLPTQTFDDIQGHWAQHDIELMAGLGIAKGVGDNKFNPDGSVTRAEFVALLVRSLDVPVEPVSETSFKDVPPDAWFAAEVEAAHKVGIAIGFEDGTFRPYAQVTREQIAAFIVRAMNWTVEEEEVDALLSRFTDQAKISSWAKKEVAAAVQKGIVLGRPDGTFDPQANATRAEAVVMLKRVLQAAGVIPPNV
ncbi:hypothetical protein COPRO5265_0448 [Coprothermobacter proteolyticus DSM 5265]|uniref:Endoxylanase n=1 Tax=Coprothermobacter proteolyticus (strain ATCC 35245 / DSM 5265 / OCM 4 / BT) TaxID=309798 RepID=B5Y7R5_COPPD|nr:Ig-like domain-containing protein [Coprothermobacter proteolyticus]ACI17337.1 hypothetical protein COPRO5265_0448 [Coprothermobacter proteolyticus DSM 5265]